MEIYEVFFGICVCELGYRFNLVLDFRVGIVFIEYFYYKYEFYGIIVMINIFSI